MSAAIQITSKVTKHPAAAMPSKCGRQFRLQILESRQRTYAAISLQINDFASPLDQSIQTNNFFARRVFDFYSRHNGATGHAPLISPEAVDFYCTPNGGSPPEPPFFCAGF